MVGSFQAVGAHLSGPITRSQRRDRWRAGTNADAHSGVMMSVTAEIARLDSAAGVPLVSIRT
jgi:ABC-type transporter Mla MlaB component